MSTYRKSPERKGTCLTLVAVGVLLSATSAARADDTPPSASPTVGMGATGSASTSLDAKAASAGAVTNKPSGTSAAVAPASDAKASSDEAAAMAAALASSSGSGGDSSSEFRLNLYGFADFGYSKINSKILNTSYNPYDTFAVGNLNLYMGAELGDSWRSLTEVRFTYLPNGQVPSSQLYSTSGGTRADTLVGDYTDLGRSMNWGGISIQRAWLERTFHKLVTVRVGHFLTPYGIWNVDHGSPVIIGVRRPFIVGESLFPQSQTGIEVWGTYEIDATILGYHLTLSNGRGPISTYQDLDYNKAIGGRLFMRNDSLLGTITLGVSGYRGWYTDRNYPTVNYVAQNVVASQYKELSLAADLKWEFRGLLVQSEAILNDIGYVDAFRPTTTSWTDQRPGFSPDYRRVGVYGLTGYRTPFFGIMPFFGGEYYNLGTVGFLPDAAAIWGGLNIRPTPRVVLKLQATHPWYPQKTMLNATITTTEIYDVQVAWSF